MNTRSGLSIAAIALSIALLTACEPVPVSAPEPTAPSNTLVVMGDDFASTAATLAVGDTVKILTGSYAGQTGTVTSVNSKNSTLVVRINSADPPMVSLNFNDVEKVTGQ